MVLPYGWCRRKKCGQRIFSLKIPLGGAFRLIAFMRTKNLHTVRQKSGLWGDHLSCLNLLFQKSLTGFEHLTLGSQENTKFTLKKVCRCLLWFYLGLKKYRKPSLNETITNFSLSRSSLATAAASSTLTTTTATTFKLRNDSTRLHQNNEVGTILKRL